MASDTIIAEIIDFIMLILHLCRSMLMAAVTGIGIVIIVRVAQLALLIGSFVIHWE
jgi:hypothetical protein